MKKEGQASEKFNEEKGFIYPFYDGSTKNQHIKGYCKKYNFNGNGIKVAKDGAGAGSTVLINGKVFNGGHSYIMYSDSLSNEFLSLMFTMWLPKFQAGTSIPSVKYNGFKDEVIEIPANHAELSKIIKRVLEYKELSKQLSKQFKDYKLAILQKADNNIKEYKEKGMHDKYISFKIGDEFFVASGNGSFKKMQKVGDAAAQKNIENGFVVPMYSAGAKNSHVIGWAKVANVDGPFIKISVSGDPGKSIFVYKDAVILEKAYALKSKGNIEINEYISQYFNNEIPKFAQGSAQKNAYFPNYDKTLMAIPEEHEELSKIISKINNWEKEVNKTTKKMEEYVNGVLQYSIKGEKYE